MAQKIISSTADRADQGDRHWVINRKSGYVFEVLPNGSTTQPTGRGGNTLSAGATETCADAVRRGRRQGYGV